MGEGRIPTQCQAGGGTGASGAAGRAGQGREVSGMLERPSSSEPSFMGAVSPALGSVLAVLSALDHPHTQGSDGGSGIPSPGVAGNSFFLPGTFLHHRPRAGREELQLKCTVQDSHSFFLL